MASQQGLEGQVQVPEEDSSPEDNDSSFDDDDSDDDDDDYESSLAVSEDELKMSEDDLSDDEWSTVEMSADEESDDDDGNGNSRDVDSPFLKLPPEILQKILGYLPFHQVQPWPCFLMCVVCIP